MVARPPLVELRHVEKAYREGERLHRVLRGVSLRVRRGEFVALLGPSGSGKSTFLNLVGGIDAPDAGEILVDGRALQGLPDGERTRFRRRHVGFVFQFYNLLPTLTVEENLLLPLELTGDRPGDAADRVRELLERVGLADRADSFPDRLSGGEQQRVAVVRALVHEPSLVLADEPTGNLDADTGERVMTLLEELVGDAGGTLILVTHSVELAARAERLLRLHRGRITEGEEGGRQGGGHGSARSDLGSEP